MAIETNPQPQPQPQPLPHGYEYIPCCKPFRIIEMLLVSTCFITFCVAHFPIDYDHEKGEMGFDSMLFIFPTYYTILVIGLIDLVSQTLRTPLPRIMMVYLCVLFSIATLVLGIIYLNHQNKLQYSNPEAFYMIVVASFLGSFSIFLSGLYVLDAAFIIRCSSRTPVV